MDEAEFRKKEIELKERGLKLQEKQSQNQERSEKAKILQTKSWIGRHEEKIKGEGFSGLLIIIGVLFHVLQGIASGFEYYRIPSLFWIQIFIGVVITIYSGLGDRNKLIKNSMLVISILLFEWFYYDIINLAFANATIPYFLAKIFWNGWILTGAFTGYNSSKIAKFFSWIIVLFLILNLFVYLPIDKYMSNKMSKIDTESIGTGFFGTITKFGDEIGCSMKDSAEKEVCLKEAEWRRAGDAKKEAMKEICQTDTAKCDCYVYTAGKDRDDCLKRQAEIRTQQRTAATKEMTETKLDFEGEATKQTYEKIIGVNPKFMLINPYKVLDITVDCSIKNSSKGDIADNFVNVIIPKERTKTSGDMPYTRNLDCRSDGEVSKGEYNFEMSTLLSNVVTSASYVGLYVSPDALYTYDPRNPDTVLKSSYDNQIKNKDKFPTGKVESVSDPDLVLLSFYIEPVEDVKVNGLEGLAGLKKGSEFNLRVVVKNNKAGSNITNVESLEFDLPNIFDVNCDGVYSESTAEDRILLKANQDKLKAAGIEKIIYSKEGKVLLGLSCKLEGNADMSNLASAYEFKGSIRYSQMVTKTFKVTQLG